MPEAEPELERIYTVPLSRAWIAPRHRRALRAVNVLKEFAQRHMKSSEIKIDPKLNEELWNRGITKPPRRITVKMSKDEDGLITISIPKKKDEEREAVSEKEETPEVEKPVEAALQPPQTDVPKTEIAMAKSSEGPKPLESKPPKSKPEKAPSPKKKKTAKKPAP
jgi:large subunit ribosomal protein L31e